VGGYIDRRRRETALGHEAACTGHDAGSLLVLAAAVSHQDERTSTGGTFRRPQHARNLAEGKELFADAIRRCLRGEAHSV
jgi:hypothetical protein